jgi:hypothetical protein
VRFLRGQAAIALSLAIPITVGAACLAADMWALYRGFARVQHAADAAVLAGAVYLPANPKLARNAARRTAQMNGISDSEIVYNQPASDGRSITIVVERSVPYHFARLLGLSRSLVTVKAVAGISGSESAAGLLPIGIQYGARYTTYQPTVLKLAPRRGTALAGNWKPLAMGVCSNCDPRRNYEHYLIGGYPKPVSVGDAIFVEVNDLATATQSGLAIRLYSSFQRDQAATPTNYAASDPRRVEVPIVDFDSGDRDGNNRGSMATVRGFAVLWVNSVDVEGNINAEFLDSASVESPRNDAVKGTLIPVLLQ